MTYSIEWHPRARRYLRKLRPDLADHIVRKAKLVSQDPFRHLEHFEGGRFYKLRIGEYRLLIDVDLSSRQLLVRLIGDRRHIYKKR